MVYAKSGAKKQGTYFDCWGESRSCCKVSASVGAADEPLLAGRYPGVFPMGLALPVLVFEPSLNTLPRFSCSKYGLFKCRFLGFSNGSVMCDWGYKYDGYDDRFVVADCIIKSVSRFILLRVIASSAVGRLFRGCRLLVGDSIGGLSWGRFEFGNLPCSVVKPFTCRNQTKIFDSKLRKLDKGTHL